MTIANIANMEKARAIHGSGVIAYSPFTHEEYSADPGDYWNASAEWVMRDCTGAVMHLVVRKVNMLDALEGFTADDLED